MAEETAHSQPLLRALTAGLAGGVSWIVAMLALFGPAQALLADPDHQHAKFLTVMGELAPLPRTTTAWWLLPVALIVMGMIYGFVYHAVRPALAGKPWRRGLRFGCVAWALMVPWFEFYLPWNVMHEPIPLVALEMVLWLGVLGTVGVVIALVYEAMVYEAMVYEAMVYERRPG